MEAILLIVGHFQHDGKKQFRFDCLIIVSDGLDVVWHKTNHTLHWDINPENIIQIMIVFNGNHDESFLRFDVGRIDN